MKTDLLYKKKNNLFQSPAWCKFQELYGRRVVKVGNFSALELDLPFGKKALWAQKAPTDLKGLSGILKKADPGYLFLRIEPAQITKKQVAGLGLKPVSSKSLLAGQKSPKATQVIDVSGSEEEILAQMKSKTRYNIRLAAKKGVTVEACDNSTTLCELLAQTAKRQKDYSPHPDYYYQKMLESLSPKDMAKVFIARNKDGEAIASVLVSICGQVATYLHGGFSDKDRNLMAPYLCHMEAIRYAKEQGCKYYDMWGVAETDDSADPWAGITRFKQGFGGEKVVFPGSYDYVYSKFWYNLFTILARLRKVVR